MQSCPSALRLRYNINIPNLTLPNAYMSMADYNRIFLYTNVSPNALEFEESISVSKLSDSLRRCCSYGY
jgi:hypothetical protein